VAESEEFQTSRRSVLKGSALGAGALLGAASLTAPARAETSPAPVSAAAAEGEQYFLKLEGITGDVVMKDFTGAIQLTEFSWGASRSADNGSSTGKQEKEKQLTVETTFSQASPLLMLAAVDGKPIKTGELDAADSQGNLFYKATLSDVIISSYQTGGVGGDRPTESISLSFGKIAFSFIGSTPEGKPNVVTARWNFESHKT
jgi:type VI secretion system secreted protein Hcp